MIFNKHFYGRLLMAVFISLSVYTGTAQKGRRAETVKTEDRRTDPDRHTTGQDALPGEIALREGNVHIRGNLQQVIEYRRHLRSEIKDPEKYKIVSFIENDSKTREKINTEFKDKILPFDYTSEQKLYEILKANAGSRIFLIGHIANGNYEVYNSQGDLSFRLSLEAIESFKKENDLTIYLFGCRSALNGTGTGFINDVNSIELLDRIKTAVQAKTHGEFYAAFASAENPFVLSEVSINEEKYFEARLHEQNMANAEHTVIDRIIILNQKSAADSSYNKADVIADVDPPAPPSGESGMSIFLRVSGTIAGILLLLFGGFYVYNKLNPVTKKNERSATHK